MAKEATTHAKQWWPFWSLVLLCLVTALIVDRAIGCMLDRVHRRVFVGEMAGAVNAAIQSNADVLILGSSRAKVHYNDEMLSLIFQTRVFNAGANGRGVLYARGLFSLVAHAHPPKVVVYDVSYNDDERQRLSPLTPFYGRDSVVTSLLDSDWRARVRFVSDAYRYNGLVFALLVNVAKDRPQWGFAPVVGQMSEVPQDVLVDRERLTFDVENQATHLVDDARGVGAEVIFVESPTWRHRFNTNALEAFEHVAEAHRVPFIRLVGEAGEPFTRPALFRDRGHLNVEGSKIFNANLAPRLCAVSASLHCKVDSGPE